MNNFLQKTLGGLTRQYYIRQFLFGLIFPAMFLFIFSQGPGVEKILSSIAFFAINSVLYPYSRYVYESVVDYILGENFIVSNIVLFTFIKFITMAMCWSFAIFIAPIGLIYLYFYHSKQEVKIDSE